MVLYKLRIDKVRDEQRRAHTVYGIDVFERTQSVPDIFTDGQSAERFVNLCNRLQLAPIHLHDVIEDALVK